MLVYPTLHYQNGGVNVNGDTETCVPGLYAAGEAFGGVHGENRLMGNSLQEMIVRRWSEALKNEDPAV